MLLDKLIVKDHQGRYQTGLSGLGHGVITLHHAESHRFRDWIRAIASLGSPHFRERSLEQRGVAWERVEWVDSLGRLSWERSCESPCWDATSEGAVTQGKAVESGRVAGALSGARTTVWDFSQPDLTHQHFVTEWLGDFESAPVTSVIDESGRSLDRATYEGWLSEARGLRGELEGLRKQSDVLRSRWQRTVDSERQRVGDLRERLAEALGHSESVSLELAGCRERLLSLQSQEEAARRRLAQSPLASKPAAVQQSSRARDWWQQLERMDRRIVGWRRGQQRLAQAIERLRDDLAKVDPAGDRATSQLLRDVQANMFEMESVTERAIRTIQESAGSGAGEESLLDDSIKAQGEALYSSLHTLYERLNQQHATLIRKSMVSRLRQMRRLHRDLGRMLQGMLDRRERILTALISAGELPEQVARRAQRGIWSEDDRASRASDVSVFAKSGSEVREHLSVNGKSTVSSGSDIATSQQLASLQDLSREIRALQERIERLTSEEESSRRVVAGLESELRRLEALLESSDDSAERHQLALQLDERETRYRRLLGLIAGFERGTTLSGGASWDACSQVLSQLSHQRWNRVAFDPQGQSLVARHADGSWLAWHELTREVQGWVLFSLALRWISQSPVGEGSWPTILLEPQFIHASSQETMERIVGANPEHQVFVGCTDLQAAGEYRVDVLVELPGWSEVSLHPRTPIVPAAETPSAWAGRRVVVHRSNNSDAEEFPGEFRDQVVREEMVSDETATWTLAESQEAYETGVLGVETEGIDPEAWIERWLAEQSRGVDMAEQASDRGGVEWSEQTLAQTPEVPTKLVRFCREHGIETLSELAAGDGEKLADDLNAAGLASVWESWQAVARLLMTGQVRRLFDARVLAACDIEHPSQIARLQSYEVLSRIRELRDTAAGRELLATGSDDELSLLASWVKSLEGSHAMSRFGYHDVAAGETDDTEGDDETAGPRATVRFDRGHQGKRRHRGPHSEGVVEEAAEEKLVFHLGLSDPLEAAPSIGPKAAGKFAEIGVETVGDFLDADADEMAELLDHPRVNTERLVAWQQQAELACRVPNLRGHDTQLLVACDVTTAEDLAAWEAEELFEVVGPFAATREGERILRAGRRPDLDEVRDWVRWAQHTRSLRAA